MRKVFLFLSLSAFAACNSNKEPKVESASTVDSTSKEKISYPYDIKYSSQFEMGDPNQSKVILNLWKDFDNGNLSDSKQYFADTVDIHLAGGMMMHASKDSIISAVQRHRDMLSAVTSAVQAVMAFRSTDRNENWVSVWGDEVDTHKDGKIDSVSLQETWRFNKDGKVDLLFQYERQLTKTKM
ncbi:MAG: hypothetical protein ACJ75B_20565 [Flavisolibacter sp.]